MRKKTIIVKRKLTLKAGNDSAAGDKPRVKLSIGRKSSADNEATTTPRRTLKGKRVVRRADLDKDKLSRPSDKFTPKSKPKKKRKVRRAKAKKPPPGLERIKGLNGVLHAVSPTWRDYHPLALGIEKEIFRIISDRKVSASKRVVLKLLAEHCNDVRYLKQISVLNHRYHLSGEIAGKITPVEEANAINKMAKRSK